MVTAGPTQVVLGMWTKVLTPSQQRQLSTQMPMVMAMVTPQPASKLMFARRSPVLLTPIASDVRTMTAMVGQIKATHSLMNPRSMLTQIRMATAILLTGLKAIAAHKYRVIRTNRRLVAPISMAMVGTMTLMHSLRTLCSGLMATVIPTQINKTPT